MKDIDEAIRQLIVKQRLHDLEMAYCRASDRRDPELMRSIFFDDAVEQHGEHTTGTVDSFIKFSSAFVKQFELTTHYVLNESYRIDGDRAEGETHRISLHRARAASAKEIVSGTRSFTRYECRDNVWKMAYRTIVRDWIDERLVKDHLFNGEFKLPMSVCGPGDLSYSALSLFGRGPLKD